MEKRVIVQKLRKKYSSDIEVAMKYYELLSTLNNLGLTERELQLLAFTAVRGNISSGGKKEEFIEMFNSSKGTIGNMIHKLGKQGLLTRIDRHTKVVPQIDLNFENGIILQLHIYADA